MSEALEVAERFFRAIEAGDVERIKTIYAPDAIIWHNDDQKEQTVEENLRVLTWVTRNLTNRHYRVKRRVAIPVIASARRTAGRCASSHRWASTTARAMNKPVEGR